MKDMCMDLRECAEIAREAGVAEDKIILDPGVGFGKNYEHNLTAINHLEMLKEIVRTDEKGRYRMSEDGTLIRANQGHSIPVDVELKETKPPKVLYHGTAERFLPSIMAQGLKSMSRLYVHLSGDYETAVKVGKRHGKPVVLSVDTERMTRDGAVFYQSENGVWLTGPVESKYLEVMDRE